MKTPTTQQRLWILFTFAVVTLGNAAQSHSLVAAQGDPGSIELFSKDDDKKTLSPREIYRQMVDSTVWVYQNGGHGTGWVVDKENGLIMTNHHVVSRGNSVKLYFAKYDENDNLVTDAEEYLKYTRPIKGVVVDSDRTRDLAIIKIEGKFPSRVKQMKMAGKSASPADRIHVVGARPEESNGVFIYANGYIREISKGVGIFGGKKIWLVRHTVPTNRGNSGGALVNDHGEVIGVHNMGYRDVNIKNVAGGMDIREVKTYLEEVTRLYPANNVKEYNLAGDRHYFNGRYSSALDYYSMTIRDDIKNSGAFRMRAWCHYYMKNLELAEKDFSTAIRLRAGNWESHYGRGLVRQAENNLTSAMTDYNEAIRLNPKAKSAYHQRGDVYRVGKKYSEAIRDYSKAVELDPKFNVGFNQRGLTYLEMGKYQEAIRDFDSAAKIQNLAIYSYNIGISYERMGNLGQAASAYSHATRLDRNYDRPWAGLGLIHLKSKDYEEAIRFLSEAIRLNPGNDFASYNRARAYFGKKLYQKALLDINFVISRNKKVAEYYALRYDIFNKLGRTTEAQTDIRYAAKLDKRYDKFVDNRHVTARPSYSGNGQTRGGQGTTGQPNKTVQGYWIYRGTYKGVRYDCAIEFAGNQYHYHFTWVDAAGKPGQIKKSGTYIISGEREITMTTRGGLTTKHVAEFKQNGWLGISFENIGMEIQFQKSK